MRNKISTNKIEFINWIWALDNIFGTLKQDTWLTMKYKLYALNKLSINLDFCVTKMYFRKCCNRINFFKMLCDCPVGSAVICIIVLVVAIINNTEHNFWVKRCLFIDFRCNAEKYLYEKMKMELKWLIIALGTYFKT